MRSLWGSGASRPVEQWHLMGRATAKWYSTVQGVTVSAEAGYLLHRVDANPSRMTKTVGNANIGAPGAGRLNATTPQEG